MGDNELIDFLVALERALAANKVAEVLAELRQLLEKINLAKVLTSLDRISEERKPPRHRYRQSAHCRKE